MSEEKNPSLIKFLKYKLVNSSIIFDFITDFPNLHLAGAVDDPPAADAVAYLASFGGDREGGRARRRDRVACEIKSEFPAREDDFG